MTENKNNGYYVLTKNVEAKQPYHFVLKASNHETILNSENYTTKDSALNGIESVKVNSQDKENFEIREAKNDEPYFVLIAQNNKIIATSETYSSMEMCKHGIDAVIKYASDAIVKGV
ncbi:YegP family protein [Sulfurimonas sp.]|uniref:YegP family protein n=1 Tax=Sulfurimonas sp. TaxID=2022749 RepID=UPI002AB118B1|nr:YegP family protein [Sulfurimonas sp.]